MHCIVREPRKKVSGTFLGELQLDKLVALQGNQSREDENG